MGPVGLEHFKDSSGNSAVASSCDAESDAIPRPPDPETQRDLNLIARVWPRLSDLTKGMVMEIIANGLAEGDAE